MTSSLSIIKSIIILLLLAFTQPVLSVAPVITIESYPMTYSYYGVTQSTLPVKDHAMDICNLVVLADTDSANLKSAEISFTSNFVVGDILVLADVGNIVVSYASGTGVLTLTGTDTVASYQAALRTIQYVAYQGYVYTDANSVHTKTLTFKVVDDDTSTESVAVTRNIVLSSAVRVYTETWFKELRVEKA